MKSKLTFLLVLSFILILVSCKREKKSDHKLFIDSEDQKEITEIIEVILFPSPGELISTIYNEQIEYQEDLLCNLNDAHKYLDQKHQALLLGVFISDFAYTVHFEQNQNTGKYLETILELSDKLNLTNAFSEDFINRIKDNIDEPDSLYEQSIYMFNYLRDYSEFADLQNIYSLVSYGAYIEGLYVALQSVDNFEKGNPYFDQIAENRYAILQLYSYLKQYENEAYIVDVLEDFSALKSVLDNVVKEKNEKQTVKAVDGKLTISGGSKYVLSEESFLRLKSTVSNIRERILKLN